MLLITVEAPRPGDHIFTLRRAGSLDGGAQYDEGTIFVRTGSATIRASSAVIRSLEERLVAGTAPAPPPVSLEFAGSLPMEWYDLEAAEGAVRSWADDHAERMITKAEQLEASRRRPPRELDLAGWGTLGAAFSSVAPLLDGSYLSAAGLVGQTPDRRSVAAFCAEVDEWKERATTAAMRRIEGRFRREHGMLSVLVRNAGDRFLEDVTIEVTLEPYATVVAQLEEPPAVPLPPREFGKPTSVLDTAISGIAYPRAAIPVPRVRPTVEADGNRVVFHIGDLRQGGNRASLAVSVVVPRMPQPPALTARWVVSARNAGISSGETTIPVAIEPVAVDEFVAAAVCNDPED